MLVGIFFFYSGYGIGRKFESSKENINKTLSSQLKKLVKIIVTTEIIYLVVAIFLFKKAYSKLEVIQYIFGIRLLNGALWYIVALVLVYCALIIFGRLMEEHKMSFTACSLMACLAYILICAIRKRPAHEMQSCIAFVIGAYVSEHPSLYESMNKKKRRLFYFADFLVFVFSNCVIYGVRFFFSDFLLVRVVFGSLSTASFVVLLCVYLSNYHVENRFLLFLGNISTEIYLSHMMILNLIEYYAPEAYGDNSIFLSLVVLGVTMLVSYCMRKLKKMNKILLMRRELK